MPINIVLENVRASYLSLFTAKAFKPGDKEKYSATAIMDKAKNVAAIKLVQATIKAVGDEKWGAGKWPKLKGTCLHEGTERRDPQKYPDSDGYPDGYGPGCMYLSASTDKRISVVDRDLTPIGAEDLKVYSGCYINMSVQIYAMDDKKHPEYGKGIYASLRTVQFVRKGEAFGAGPADPTKEFKALPAEDDASAGDPALE
jgi:hypothetical protein